MKSIRIYLSGSIRKGADDPRDESHYWSASHEDEICRRLAGMPVRLLNPAKTKISRNDYYANFGCDLYLVSISQVVLVDLREEKGIGVGAELMFARQHGIPCIGWAPRNSHYRRDHVADVFGENLHDWIHPFAHGLTDALAETLGEAVDLVMQRLDRTRSPLSVTPRCAIEHFRRLYPYVAFND